MPHRCSFLTFKLSTSLYVYVGVLEMARIRRVERVVTTVVTQPPPPIPHLQRRAKKTLRCGAHVWISHENAAVRLVHTRPYMYVRFYELIRDRLPEEVITNTSETLSVGLKCRCANGDGTVAAAAVARPARGCSCVDCGVWRRRVREDE